MLERETGFALGSALVKLTLSERLSDELASDPWHLYLSPGPISWINRELVTIPHSLFILQTMTHRGTRATVFGSHTGHQWASMDLSLDPPRCADPWSLPVASGQPWLASSTLCQSGSQGLGSLRPLALLSLAQNPRALIIPPGKTVAPLPTSTPVECRQKHNIKHNETLPIHQPLVQTDADTNSLSVPGSYQAWNGLVEINWFSCDLWSQERLRVLTTHSGGKTQAGGHSNW